MIIQNNKIKTLLLTAVLALLTVGGASAAIPYGTLLKHVDQFPLVPVTLNNGTVINQMAWATRTTRGCTQNILLTKMSIPTGTPTGILTKMSSNREIRTTIMVAATTSKSINSVIYTEA